MHLIRHLPESADCASAVAIGNFDGLHRGHAAVIEAMLAAAEKHGIAPSVLTFEPHPRRFFSKATPAFRIERLQDKYTRLKEAGVAQLFMPRFDASFAAMPAGQFLEEVLGQKLGAKVVVTGENFAFGHKRGGDSAMLKAWGKKHNIEIVTMLPVAVEGEICSSSAVREAIKNGDMAQAEMLLGHPYRLTGRVVQGQQRGRTIGFPTANIALPPDLLLPAYGVYAVSVTIDGARHFGVANLGIRPTVAVDKRATLEVYVFDVMQDMYGKKLAVQLVGKLRDEMKFDGLDALKKQIAIDCEQARLVLARLHD